MFGYGAALNVYGDVESWWGHGMSWTTIRGPFTAASGGELSCGILADGGLRWWWALAPAKAVPADALPAGVFTSVCSGWHFNCALSSDGSPDCFGDWADEAILSVPSARFSQMSCGSMHACGVTPDHEIVCWGDLSHGEGTPPD